MASNRLSDIADSDTETRLPPPDSPVRDRQADSPVRDIQGPNANGTDDSEVIINRNAGRRRQSRSREMVHIPRTDLNNLYDEMRQLRNEVYRVRNGTHRLDIQQRNHRDGSSDEELDINNNETPNNRMTRTDDSSEGPAPQEANDPYEEPYRHSTSITHRN